MDRELLGSLRELGFTEYEAKAYSALLGESPLTGYGVARGSGVPRSKVYEVLEGLSQKGAVLVSRGESGARYAPLPPKELIARRRREMEESLGAAERNLERHAAAAGGRTGIWDIEGRRRIFDRAREVVGRAEGRVFLEVWEEDAPELEDALAGVARRGVEVVVVAYGDPGYPFARVYRHDLVDEVARGVGGRWVVLSADAREIVAGIVSIGEESRAAWSSHPGLVVPVTELIKHDVYIQEMLDGHRDVLEASFGPGLLWLRERLQGMEALGEAAEFP